ncbi:MAG: glycosyltransferase family 2 protein [Acidobacteriota bacterium]
MSTEPDLSVIVPFYDEEDNVGPVIRELAGVLDTTGLIWEIVAVDDGSADRTLRCLLDQRTVDRRIRVLRMRCNSCQTAAMRAGFDAARGRLVVSMDGDGQNDPSAITALLARLDEGYDLVCGWRAHRQDRMLSRKLPSWIANRLIALVTGIPIHDNGCSLRAYRRALLRRLPLYGDQHRFIPALAALRGARIAEMKVPHRARRSGRSKYGLSRTYKVLLDLLTVRLLRPLVVAPVLPFVAAGLAFLAVAALALVMTAQVWLRDGSLVVWAGTSFLAVFMAGYLCVLAFLSELLRQDPGARAPGPLLERRRPLLPVHRGGTS